MSLGSNMRSWSEDLWRGEGGHGLAMAAGAVAAGTQDGDTAGQSQFVFDMIDMFDMFTGSTWGSIILKFLREWIASAILAF